MGIHEQKLDSLERKGENNHISFDVEFGDIDLVNSLWSLHKTTDQIYESFILSYIYVNMLIASTFIHMKVVSRNITFAYFVWFTTHYQPIEDAT